MYIRNEQEAEHLKISVARGPNLCYCLTGAHVSVKLAQSLQLQRSEQIAPGWGSRASSWEQGLPRDAKTKSKEQMGFWKGFVCYSSLVSLLNDAVELAKHSQVLKCTNLAFTSKSFHSHLRLGVPLPCPGDVKEGQGNEDLLQIISWQWKWERILENSSWR